jgi:heat shock protein HslJ
MRALEKLRIVLSLLVAAFFPVWAAAASPVNLAGSEWGFAGETGKAARFVQFRSGGKIGGHSGCNRFAGAYTQNDDALTMGPLATTRMACQPEAMEREQQFLAMLGNVRQAEGTQLKLTLKDSDGKVLAKLVRRDSE